jgi:short-subunit dehydrogenase
MRLDNKKILITGGSAGIGKAFIMDFASRGVKSIAVMGRKKEALYQLQEEFPAIDFIMLQGDISSVSDIDRAIENISEEWQGLDILINNAGVVSADYLEDISDEDIINQVNINLTGLLLLTKKALPLLKKSKEGAIINISSGLGYIAQPFYSVYAATKAGVRQFSDAMRRELHAYPIHVMTIYPTTTDTPMMKNAVVKSKMDSPEDVAHRSIEGLINGDVNVIFGGEQRIKDINTNFHEPDKIDQKSMENFEAMRIRTENHRAM